MSLQFSNIRTQSQGAQSVGGATGPVATAQIGGQAVAQVPPGPLAQGIVGHQPAPPPPPPALVTYKEFKQQTKLDGFFRQLVDKRSTGLKTIDAKAEALLPQMARAEGMSDRELLSGFKALKQAHDEFSGAVHAWDPSQHARGAKVTTQTTQVQARFDAIQQRFDALIGQNLTQNAAALARQHGGGLVIADMIAEQASTPQAAIKDFMAALNGTRVMMDDVTLTQAQSNDLTMLRFALQAKLDPASQFTPGQAGNTQLHQMLSNNAGSNDAILNHVQNNQSDLNKVSDIGHSPLTLAIRRPDPEIARKLIQAGADVNTPGLFGVFKPLDFARAFNRPDIIPELKANNAIGGINSDQLKPSTTQNLSTEQILMRGALSSDASTETYFRTGLQNLIAEPKFTPILELAAQRMIGDPANEADALRMNFIGLRDAGILVGGLGAGSYQPDTNTLNVAAKESQKDMQGTVIHELTHHAVEVLFDNDTQPFPASDMTNLSNSAPITGSVLESYLDAISADKIAGSISTDPQADKVMNTVIGRVNSYNAVGAPFNYKNESYTKAMMQEYVVGIPQAINDFGYAAVQATTPNLLAFYEQIILPRASQETQRLASRTQP